MVVENPIPQREIDVSVMSFLDSSMMGAALWPVERFVELAQEADYGKLEWHPIRWTVAGMQMQSGILTPYAKKGIGSLHQSWRSEKKVYDKDYETNGMDVWHHDNRKLAAISYILLPERVASLADLEQIQRVVGRELPVVLFPTESPREESGTARVFGEKLFQPTPEVMKRWGVHTPEQLRQAAIDRGYTGYALDLFHIRRGAVDGHTLFPWQETLPELLAFTKEIQVGAGRTDIKENTEIDTVQELKDLISGNGTSELMDMWPVIRRYGRGIRIITETVAAELKALRIQKQGFVTLQDILTDHKQIVHTLQDMLG